MSKPKLTPPDPDRCQVEWQSGSFMTLGPRQMERCTSRPDWIATEKRPGKDGQRGSMSMCDEHRKVFEKKHPGQATFKKVDPNP
jgi:hypothetical protein